MGGRVRRGRLIGALLVGCGALWALAAVALDLAGRAQRAAERADLIAVPGCRVTPEGLPSPCLARRVEAAVALWREGRAPRILLTGGGGPVAEAAAAARHARALGVPEAALVVEDRSTSTWENAAFGMALAPARRVIVVTDPYHLPRARLCFGRFAATSGHPTPEPPGRAVGMALREVGALVAYAARGRCLGGRRTHR